MKKTTSKRIAFGAVVAFAMGLTSPATAGSYVDKQLEQAASFSGDTAPEGGEENGTDPRDFAAKFMPYYRYNKIDNGLESHETTLFGLIPIPFGEMFFDKPEYKWAITYEFPAVKYVDASAPIGRVGRQIRAIGASSKIGRGQGLTAPVPANRPDDKVWGTGDLNMRLLIPIYEAKNFPIAFMTGAELWLPTASHDLLGTGKWQVAPHLTAVIDIAKDKGIFLASMNFWRTSFAGDSERDDIELYVGRHFLNLPFGRSGYYMLTEVQTIADLENGGDWEVWVGPEFGKILKPGRILYGKPGFGIDPDSDEREWSFELGYRHFF